MAMESISLTSGIRANLVSLQNTSSMLEKVQERLATGKRVNSALDNPTSFFTALGHNNRAKDLESFKDAMGEAVQTVKAADKGIEAINSLIESAKAVAKDAKGTNPGTNTQTITLANVAAGETIEINGTTYTASTGADAASGVFNISGDDTADAASLLAAIQANDTDLTASASTDTITLQGTLADTSVTTSASTFTEGTISTDSEELTNLVAQYNELMDQINEIGLDSDYEGRNLLRTGTENDLTVFFDEDTDHNLTIQGFDGTYSGLGLEKVSVSDWNNQAGVQSDIDDMDAAFDTLRVQASKLSSNLSIITTREDFTTGMVNTLEEGADNLTLADMNEEAANMLMLQTRQSLGTSSLSMASQAAQSVMQLF